MTALMIPYLLAVYIHILAAVLWVGYVLFWTILIGPLRQKFEPTESARLAKFMNQAAWPPAIIPVPYRLQFWALGWLFLLVMIASGGFLLYARGLTTAMHGSEGLFSHPFGQPLAAKLGLVLGVMVCQVLLSFRTTPTVIYLCFVLSLSIVALSIFLVRS